MTLDALKAKTQDNIKQHSEGVRTITMPDGTKIRHSPNSQPKSTVLVDQVKSLLTNS